MTTETVRYVVFNIGPSPVEVIVKNGKPNFGFGLETGDEIDLDVEPGQTAYVRPVAGTWEWQEITLDCVSKNWRRYGGELLAEVVIDLNWEEVAS